MDEFNLDNSFEIGTSISKIKNTKNKNKSDNDLLYLIKDLENRLDNIESSNTTDSLQLTTPIIRKAGNKEEKKEKKIENNKHIFKYTELIIFMIFFILLNDKFTITLIYNIPNFKTSPYPNLILRTLIFGLLVYLYKRFVK